MNIYSKPRTNGVQLSDEFRPMRSNKQALEHGIAGIFTANPCTNGLKLSEEFRPMRLRLTVGLWTLSQQARTNIEKPFS